jgi:cytochrome c biogenesis protein
MMGHDIGECFIGKITTKDGNEQDVILPVQFRSFDKMRKGDVAVTLIDFEKKYYTGLQVTKDPGVYLVYLGFILMVIGCYIAFFMSHQSLCVEVVKIDDSSYRTVVHGYANKNRMGMAMVVRKLASLLKTL